jgi:hypothetical protein
VHSSEWLTTCWLTLSYIPFSVTPDCVFAFSNTNALNITPRLVVCLKFCLWTIKRPNPLPIAAHTVCDVIFLHWNTRTKTIGLCCEWHHQHSCYAVLSQCITNWFEHLKHVQQVDKRGLNFLTLQLHLTKKKKTLQSNSQNKYQLYKKGYIYLFAQLMFIYIWWSFVNTPNKTFWIMGAFSYSCVCC